MKFLLKANLLEVTSHTFTKEGKEYPYYIGHFHQPGVGVDQYSVSKELFEKGVAPGAYLFSVSFEKGKVRILDVIKG